MRTVIYISAILLAAVIEGLGEERIKADEGFVTFITAMFFVFFVMDLYELYKEKNQ